MKTIENISIVIITIGFFIVWAIGGALVTISLFFLTSLDIIEGSK